MKYSILLFFLIASCTVIKPQVCITEVVVSYEGPTDKPVFPLVFTTQSLYSDGDKSLVAGKFDGRYSVSVDKNEFEMINSSVAHFRKSISATNNSDLAVLGVMTTDSCKKNQYEVFGQNNSKDFFRFLLKTTEKFRPEKQGIAKEFIVLTARRCGAL